MRRILITGLCALYWAFGSVAGVAHVHGAAGHREEARGLHLDHAHLAHHGDHERDDSLTGRDDADARADSLHIAHHSGDAVYLSQSAMRLFPIVRVLPAIVPVGPAIECPLLVSGTAGVRSNQPRDPPEKILPRLRAPPA